jgi:hypothetical protein
LAKYTRTVQALDVGASIGRMLILGLLFLGLVQGASAAPKAIRVRSDDGCATKLAMTAISPQGYPEVRGTATRHGQLWALGFGARLEPPQAIFGGMVSPPFPDKIIWRMTGTGPLRIVALSPTGQRINPVWGPDRHTSSSWTGHPGKEWGTGWFFWQAGCYRIHATRGRTTGDLWFILR